MGAIHFEMNTGCEPAVFVAAFNNEDPGVLSIAQRYFGLPPDIVGAALGGLGVEEVVGLESKIPDNVAVGTDECLKRCGLTRPSSQPTKQLQPIVSGNSPSGVSVPATSTSSSASSSTPTSTAKVALAVTPTTSAGSHSIADNAVAGAAGLSANDASGNSVSPSPILIALVVINGLLVVGLLVALFLYIRSRHNVFNSHKYAPPTTHPESLIKAENYELGHESTYYDPYTPSQPKFKESS